jgi:hypothetical protein
VVALAPAGKAMLHERWRVGREDDFRLKYVTLGRERPRVLGFKLKA